MDRNTVAAFAILFLILLFYPRYMKIITPPAPEESEVVATNAVGRQDAAGPATPRSEAGAEDPLVTSASGALTEAVRPAAAARPLTVDIETEKLLVTFSNIGGGIQKLVSLTKRNGTREENTLLDLAPGAPSDLALVMPGSSINVEYAPFVGPELSEDGRNVVFSYTLPNQLHIVKRFTVDDDQSVIRLSITVENPTLGAVPFSFELGSILETGMGDADGKRGQDSRFDMMSLAAYTKTDSEIARGKFNHLKKKGMYSEGRLEWVGLAKRYFAVLIKPEHGTSFDQFRGSADDAALRGAARVVTEPVPGGGSAGYDFFIYAGPTARATLKSFDAGFEGMLSTGKFLGFFKMIMLVLLSFFYGVFKNYGLAIIAVAVIVKVAFWPLTHKGMMSMQKMQALQPKIKAMQEQYKNNPEKLQKETMEFYKRHKVNPVGGCLPMFIQIPVFIALYNVLAEAVELRGAPFFGFVHDLAEPDAMFTLPFTLPFLGNAIRLLPVLYIATSVLQMKLQPTTASANPDQQKIMKFMPIMIGFIFYNMPSGLVLYFLVSNILMIVDQALIRRKTAHLSGGAAPA